MITLPFVLIAASVFAILILYSYYGPPVKTAGQSTSADPNNIPKPKPELYMDVSTSDGWNNIYSSYPIGVEHVTSDSVLVGKEINRVRLTLSKVGHVTGTATIGVFDNNGNLKFAFGNQDVSRLGTNPVDRAFTTASPYTIVSGDRIGIKFSGGDSGNWLKLHQANSDQFDDTNSVLGWYVQSSGHWTDGVGDLRMQLIWLPQNES